MSQLFAVPKRAPAAMRFLSTFYHWTVLNQNSPHCARIISPLKRATALLASSPSQPRCFSTKQDSGRGREKHPKESAGHKDCDNEIILSEASKVPQVFTLSEAVRHIMRHVPSSVAVVTAIDKPQDGDYQIGFSVNSTPWSPYFRAMTISSFTTVSLADEPIISFNVRLPSRTYDAISRQRFFTVNIPAANEVGASLADAFTRGHSEEAFAQLDLRGYEISFPEDTRHFGPSFLGAAVSASITCELLPEQVKLGDHVVVFAKVVKASNEERPELSMHSGLAYSNRLYGRICNDFGAKHRK